VLVFSAIVILTFLLVSFGNLDDFEICVFDNRGVHRSSVPPGPYSTEEMARDAVCLIDDLGWARAHVVGVSMGGMIAQKLALQAPEKVISVTLIATCGLNSFNYPPTLFALKQCVLIAFERSNERHVEKSIDLMFPQQYLEAKSNDETKTNRDLLADDFLRVLQEEPQNDKNGEMYQARAAMGHYLTEGLRCGVCVNGV
jgi:pimeloyl-ACP methyl ester carboxylesterase